MRDRGGERLGRMVVDGVKSAGEKGNRRKSEGWKEKEVGGGEIEEARSGFDVY